MTSVYQTEHDWNFKNWQNGSPSSIAICRPWTSGCLVFMRSRSSHPNSPEADDGTVMHLLPNELSNNSAMTRTVASDGRSLKTRLYYCLLNIQTKVFI